MDLILLFILYTFLFNIVFSVDYLQPDKISINDSYYQIAKLGEPCVVDNSTVNSYVPPIQRGIGKNNCEIGLTCFNFKCVLPSKEGDFCVVSYFEEKSEYYDNSNCTNEFFCDPNANVCKRTKPLKSSCERDAECITGVTPNARCKKKKCVPDDQLYAISGERYILIFFFMSVLIYIYYRQYTIQEAQLNRLNELIFDENYSETRRDPEIETLPPYSPPSSAFLQNDDNNSQCSNVPTLRSPPSYHQFPTYNLPPPMVTIETSNTNESNNNTNNENNNTNNNNTDNNNNNNNNSTNNNTTNDINNNNNNNSSNSIYPVIINQLSNSNTNLNNSNDNTDSARLSVHRLSQLSGYSYRSSQIPNTPPPSYSQPTSPYNYNIEPSDDGSNDDSILPPTASSTQLNRRISGLSQRSLAHQQSLSRIINVGNPTQNRYSTISNPDVSRLSLHNRNSRLSLSSFITATDNGFNNSNIIETRGATGSNVQISISSTIDTTNENNTDTANNNNENNTNPPNNPNSSNDNNNSISPSNS